VVALDTVALIHTAISSGDQVTCKTLKVAGGETGHRGSQSNKAGASVAPTGGKHLWNFVTVDDVGRQAGRKGTLKEPTVEVIQNTWLKIPKEA